MFLRQSVRSDYCLVYATAMMLSRIGFPTDRRAALHMFGAGRRGTTYAGTEHHEVIGLLRRREVVSTAVWHYLSPPLTFLGIHAAITVALAKGGTPTLVAFGAIHRRLRVRCSHAAVVLSAEPSRIHLLDSLGQPPRGAGGNVVLGPAGRRGISVEGAIYDFDRAQPFGVLHWKRPKERSTQNARQESMKKQWQITMRRSSGVIDRLEASLNERVVITSHATEASAKLEHEHRSPPASLTFRAEGEPNAEVEIEIGEIDENGSYTSKLVFAKQTDYGGALTLTMPMLAPTGGGFGAALKRLGLTRRSRSRL